VAKLQYMLTASKQMGFYPRDAILARVLAMAMCLFVRMSVCLSQVGVPSKRLDESSWVLGTGASFHPSYTVLTGNSAHSKNKGTSLWNSVPNSRLRKFCFGTSIVETCYQLTSRKMDAQNVINWTVDNTSELRRSTAVVYRSDRQALSTARFRRAGQLATADTCQTLEHHSAKARSGPIHRVN